MRNVSACLCVAIFVVVTPVRVGAQTPEENEAFTLYRAAKIDMDALKFQDALTKLDQASRLFKMPQIIARQAECYEKMGEMERALDLYRKVQTEDPKLRGKVEKSVADIVFELNKPVDLSIVPNVNDVEVTVDHVERFKAPCTIQVTRGEHTFDFRKSGYASLTEEKKIAGAAVQFYKVTLGEQAGRVVLLTDLDTFAGTLVRLDDREMSPTGLAGIPNRADPVKVRAGTHNLLCVKENLPPFMTTFEVAPDVTVEISCKLKPAEAKPIVPTWAAGTTLGAGLAVAGVGGVFLGLYLKDKKEYDDHPETYKSFSSNMHIVGYTLLGVGGAAIITSIVLFVVKKTPEAEGSVSPLAWGVGAAPTEGGAMASGYVRF